MNWCTRYSTCKFSMELLYILVFQNCGNDSSRNVGMPKIFPFLPGWDVPSPPENFGIDVHGRYSSRENRETQKDASCGKKGADLQEKADIFMVS